jgi:sugar phosphate permease
MAYAALCHFNRISMSVAGTEQITKNYAISDEQIGLVYSAYLLIYTIFMTPGGWLIDRRGPKIALVLMGFGSASFAAMTGVAGLIAPAGFMFASLLVIRGLMGLVNAPIHPAAARVVSFWVPSSSRPWVNGLVNSAALAGIASTYGVFGKLMDWFGWQQAFMIAGVATALVAGLWTVYARDDPGQHTGVNDSDRRFIGGNDAEPLSSRTAGPVSAVIMSRVWHSVGMLMRNRSLLFLTLSYAAVGYFEYLFFYWVQKYFAEVLELGTEKGRGYATTANLGMMVGMFLGGWVAGWAQTRFGYRRGRAFVPVLGLVAGALFLWLGTSTRNEVVVAVCFTLAMAAVGTVEGPFWTTAIELGGRHGGTSAAIFNTGGNAGGIVAPVVTPVFGHFLGWEGGFALGSGVALAGALLWWWIDPSEQCAERRRDDAFENES